MTQAQDNKFPYITIAETSVPANPTAGNQKIYIDPADHKVKLVNSSGAITIIDASAITALATIFSLTGDITPAQITSNQDDYNPTGLSTASVLRLSTDASRNLNGLAGGADGRIIIIHNVGTTNLVIKDEAGTSTAANRFALTADITLAGDAVCLLQYDSTSSRWRVVGGAGSGGSGDVTGPGSSTDGNVALFNGATGKIIKDGGTLASNMWTQVVNESGASMTNWTSGGGTWASDGTVIKQTDTGAAWRTLKYNTAVDSAAGFVLEADIKLVSTGGSGTLRAIGIVAGYAGTNSSPGPAAELRNTAGTKTMSFERAFTTVLASISNSFAEDTFIKMRMVTSGGLISAYLDGVLIGTAGNTPASSGDARYIGLLSIGCEAHFKNIKGYSIKLP